MYLFGTFIGSKYQLTIDATTKKADVESFLKDHPEFKDKLTNEEAVRYQYKLMGIEYVKPVVKAKQNGSKKR
mgnify:CR=1 FL=1